MAVYPHVYLAPHKADAVRRFHPWIFSGAIVRKDPGIAEGSLVEVHEQHGGFLAFGYYSNGSIAVRILSFSPVDDLPRLWLERIQAAYLLRRHAGLAGASNTNVYRLFNAEGDGVPGLIIDFYNGTCVVQAHSTFIYSQRHHIAEALKQVLGPLLKAVYDKSEQVLERKSKTPATGQYLMGDTGPAEVLEYGHRFAIDMEGGQKTGFFIDQRENRRALARYASGRTVLNTFCYSGGFSVYAAQAGAALVHSVDSSARAIELCKQNAALNQIAATVHEAYTADVFDYLKKAPAGFYDLMVLDPPAFAKNQHSRHAAVQAYKRLNRAAFEKLKSGGIVFTFSCSQAVGPEYFLGAVTAAAIECGKNIRILEHLAQPADHAQSIYHPEGLYLKGLVLYVA